VARLLVALADDLLFRVRDVLPLVTRHAEGAMKVALPDTAVPCARSGCWPCASCERSVALATSGDSEMESVRGVADAPDEREVVLGVASLRSS
jgi:hypothetical protein